MRGVMLPSEGRHWVSWDPVEREKPNRWWRRWGTDRLVRSTLGVVRDYADDHPGAPRVLIGDMSRPRGGDFGTDYGPIGHATHQNGLDVDVYYPRLDRREWTPRLPEQVDVDLAQDLVDRFVAAGAETVYVGPSLPLTARPGWSSRSSTTTTTCTRGCRLQLRLPEPSRSCRLSLPLQRADFPRPSRPFEALLLVALREDENGFWNH